MYTKNPAFAIAIATAGLLAATSAYAAKPISADEFVKKASLSNMFEIESSQLAIENAQHGDVIAFAETMVADHSNAGEKMKMAVEESKAQTGPAQALDAKHQKLMNKLQAEDKDDFDETYIEIQLSAHKEAVNLFSNYAKNGRDPALKNFALETLPTLQQHLQHVKELNKKID